MAPVFSFRARAASQFENLLRPHVEHLYRLAWRFTGNKADAEDLVQDVLLKLYRRTHELARIEQLRPWLAKVLYHQYIELVRQRARSPLADPAIGTDGDGDPLDALLHLTAGPEGEAGDVGESAGVERMHLSKSKRTPPPSPASAPHCCPGWRCRRRR